MTSLASDHLSGDALLHRVWEQMGRPAHCRVVGGWVRDRLLDRPTGDLDLTIEGDTDTAGEPAQLLAAAFDTRAHLLGTTPHRVWRIETPGLSVELWPMGTLIHREDMMRRDFSVNALSWELPDGPLTDFVGGVADLEATRLRAVSRDNLADDPIRLLRGPRFLAQFKEFELETRTRIWITELASGLATAPRERIGKELRTLLRAPSASRGLAEIVDLGLFEPIAPSKATIDEPWLRGNLTALDRLCGAGAQRELGRSGTIDATPHLALLLKAWGAPTGGMIASYSWPQVERENALRAARFLDTALATVDASAADRRELAWLAGGAFPALLALASAVDPGHHGWRRWRRQWRHNPRALTDPRPLLSGNEITDITGIGPGPELGRIAKDLLRAQVRHEVKSRDGAVRWLGRQR